MIDYLFDLRKEYTIARSKATKQSKLLEGLV